MKHPCNLPNFEISTIFWSHFKGFPPAMYWSLLRLGRWVKPPQIEQDWVKTTSTLPFNCFTTYNQQQQRLSWKVCLAKVARPCGSSITSKYLATCVSFSEQKHYTPDHRHLISPHGRCAYVFVYPFLNCDIQYQLTPTLCWTCERWTVCNSSSWRIHGLTSGKDCF